jgi:hypothetical protein
MPLQIHFVNRFVVKYFKHYINACFSTQRSIRDCKVSDYWGLKKAMKRPASLVELT